MAIFSNKKTEAAHDEANAKLAAIGRVQATIEFELDGTIITANENFLVTLGYELSEVVGKHHKMFVDPAFVASAEYEEFWAKLGRGEFHAAEFKRVSKDGGDVWIQASYNPIFDRNGKPYKIVKFATDVTAQKLQNADSSGQLDAISKSQAVIEFNTDGEILTANKNFLNALGYQLEEIQGRHHSMFVQPAEAGGPEYQKFWTKLKQGEYQAAEYLRIGKGGKEVWIQASYNPIFDLNGKPYKVVKYATDITGRKSAVQQLSTSLAMLAEGDLNARIENEFTPDLEEVRNALNQTVDQLISIVGQIRKTSSGLKSATGEILAGANDLSERTTRQAAAIEETSAAMEQLATTVVDNSKKADAATEKTLYTSKLATEGGEVMGNATTAMERITSSSTKISNIIGMIDDIAFQTNLLALNASVEAARAGEAGKGFAVVAVEVRRLAQSAAEASSQVKTLIEQSASEVSGGSKLVAEASEKLAAMLISVQENSELMNAISAASREQASGIEEVSSAVRQMDEMTQHNAALVEETNAAIEQTEVQASELDRIVDVFKVADNTARHGQADVSHTSAVAPNGAKSSQQKIQSATTSYKTNGNAAIKEEWG
ncbi:methyl-accepting chemotaxis protein [Maritalea porphyrae]|uniref:methyl-accepting chemotaxis protein n=1 Tax=Maritalea porphyrae TaxID=880732 RepID=UPI0022AFF27E|nr:methyl-accepting chemotaxis protein [Maritalea porphyrae]MCZ4271302.1 methyl-accepting chemotaxis protein [Maritalea porphyrae]